MRPAAASGLGSYDWVVLTSARAVERLLAEVSDARAFGGVRLAAVGPATAAALAERGLVADLVPDEAVGEALVEVFPTGTGRVLVPAAAGARDVVPDGLAAKGWTVDSVEAPARSATSSRAASGANPISSDSRNSTSSSAASARTISHTCHMGVTVKSRRFIDTWAHASSSIQNPLACTRGSPPPDSRMRRAIRLARSTSALSRLML